TAHIASRSATTPSRSSGASPPASTSGTGASSTAPRPAAPPASTTPTDQPFLFALPRGHAPTREGFSHPEENRANEHTRRRDRPAYRSHAPWQAAPLHHRGPPRSDQARTHPHPPQARTAHRPRAHGMVLRGEDQRLTTPALAPRNTRSKAQQRKR